MESTFWIKLGLSFVVGGIWVSLTTFAAERFGSKIGGLLGGFPSTAVVTLFFIGITQTPHIASQATTIMPFSQGFNGIFIIMYTLFAKRGLVPGIFTALLAWFLLATIVVSSGIENFFVSVVGWLFLFIGCYIILENYMNITSQPKIAVHYSALQILLRALFGGTVIAFAVLMGKLGGPIYGGIFATFPAMFIATLIITHRSRGYKFSQAVAKALMVSGVLNVALYAIFVRYVYLWTGLLAGTAIAITISCGTVYLTYLFMRFKVS